MDRHAATMSRRQSRPLQAASIRWRVLDSKFAVSSSRRAARASLKPPMGFANAVKARKSSSVASINPALGLAVAASSEYVPATPWWRPCTCW